MMHATVGPRQAERMVAAPPIAPGLAFSRAKPPLLGACLTYLTWKNTVNFWFSKVNLALLAEAPEAARVGLVDVVADDEGSLDAAVAAELKRHLAIPPHVRALSAAHSTCLVRKRRLHR